MKKWRLEAGLNQRETGKRIKIGAAYVALLRHGFGAGSRPAR